MWNCWRPLGICCSTQTICKTNQNNEKPSRDSGRGIVGYICIFMNFCNLKRYFSWLLSGNILPCVKIKAIKLSPASQQRLRSSPRVTASQITCLFIDAAEDRIEVIHLYWCVNCVYFKSHHRANLNAVANCVRGHFFLSSNPGLCLLNSFLVQLWAFMPPL